MKSLADILAQNTKDNEVYTSDQKKRYWRSQKGYYTRNEGVFSFIHLIQNWQIIVGDFMGQNTMPLKIKQRTLFVACKHSIFAQELGFLAPQIIDKIHEKFPSFNQIKKIKFTHNDFQAHFKEKEQKEQGSNKEDLHPFSPEYKARMKKAESLTEDIEDQDVKQAIINFYLK